MSRLGPRSRRRQLRAWEAINPLSGKELRGCAGRLMPWHESGLAQEQVGELHSSTNGAQQWGCRSWEAWAWGLEALKRACLASRAGGQPDQPLTASVVEDLLKGLLQARRRYMSACARAPMAVHALTQ